MQNRLRETSFRATIALRPCYDGSRFPDGVCYMRRLPTVEPRTTRRTALTLTLISDILIVLR